MQKVDGFIYVIIIKPCILRFFDCEIQVRPLFIDFLFFITTCMYFHCRTNLLIITNLAIITLNDDLHVHV